MESNPIVDPIHLCTNKSARTNPAAMAVAMAVADALDDAAGGEGGGGGGGRR